MLDGVGISWPGGSPENTGLILALIVGAYFVVLWFSAVVWTARDIHQRTPEPMAQLVFTLIVLVFNFPGLVVYRVLRPPLTLQEAEEHRLESSALLRELEQTLPCPRCGGEIAEDYLACPRCALPLRLSCESCARVLDPEWQICPWCTTEIPRLSNEPAPPPPGAPVASSPRDIVAEAESQHAPHASPGPTNVQSSRIPTLD
ncbi:MAG: zinc ribbon domain-containing protein [Chloroflexota bacterium]|nr:zinc ribbon domain-containing protein [Chloroflexota bacterium]MDE2892819.1 zinc ribbon domain-containing protein [Chloroflexota bacterium]